MTTASNPQAWYAMQDLDVPSRNVPQFRLKCLYLHRIQTLGRGWA